MHGRAVVALVVVMAGLGAGAAVADGYEPGNAPFVTAIDGSPERGWTIAWSQRDGGSWRQQVPPKAEERCACRRLVDAGERRTCRAEVREAHFWRGVVRRSLAARDRQ